MRFDLNICKETNELQKEVRRILKEKGYIRKASRTNRYIGAIHFNSMTEYFIKGNLIFEVERDLENGVVSAMLHYYNTNGEKEHKNVRLADIKDLA